LVRRKCGRRSSPPIRGKLKRTRVLEVVSESASMLFHPD
jgi:hypothetical protein